MRFAIRAGGPFVLLLLLLAACLAGCERRESACEREHGGLRASRFVFAPLCGAVEPLRF